MVNKIQKNKMKPVRAMPIDPETMQENLMKRTHVYYSHGGREHGHDWDDWLKDERKFKRVHEKKMKLRNSERRI